MPPVTPKTECTIVRPLWLPSFSNFTYEMHTAQFTCIFIIHAIRPTEMAENLLLKCSEARMRIFTFYVLRARSWPSLTYLHS